VRKSLLGKIGAGISAIAISVALSVVPTGGAMAQEVRSTELDRHFTAAAKEFGVPKELLLSISYAQTRWEDHGGKPSVAGGYGLMHLTASFEQVDARGDASRPLPTTAVPSVLTLDEAAKLTNISAQRIKTDEQQNIRAGAALLASYGKQTNDGKTPGSLGAWYAATVKISALATSTEAQAFADSVYDTIAKGAARTTKDGQKLSLKATPVQVDRSLAALPELRKAAPRNASAAECPKALDCRFVPARHAQNTDDPKDYGNYDVANRPKDMKIKYIVIHDTEGSYQSAISWFQDQRSYVAAQYVIRSSDGQVTQMVRNSDVAWHAGSWYMNMHSIGIEHEGYAAEGAAWYTDAMYRSSAKLVRHLAKQYNIPLDRQHIVGHDQYHGLTPARATAMHTDPGPYWDWDYYMQLLKAPQPQDNEAGPNSKTVTIAPRFASNKQTVTRCDAAQTCTELPKQGTNFVYLRTEPRASAPLLTDPGLHPDGASGTTKVEDISAKAVSGQKFAVAERRGDWTAIWFGGYKGWFYNPTSRADRTAVPSRGHLVTPKPGVQSVPVYGRPVPEAGAYPNGMPPLSAVPLQYKLAAGQSYVAYDKTTPNDYFHVLTFDRSTPGDGEIAVGNERYVPISFGHRQGYVKASDVTSVH
jgi:N-acetyl-anhydromuramyl-L-alanine amidase AmpD